MVTGASSGLGAGFARALAHAGANVVIAARREDRLKALADELREIGREPATVVADVADPEDCARVADAAVDAFGGIDGLVNNAGLGSAVSALKETPEGFRRLIDVNLNGVFWMAQACAARMENGGSIVNVASVLGQVAPRFPQAAYAASKAGVIGLTRDLAGEWSARRRIRVNALCPGYFDSEMTAGRGRRCSARWSPSSACSAASGSSTSSTPRCSSWPARPRRTSPARHSASTAASRPTESPAGPAAGRTRGSRAAPAAGRPGRRFSRNGRDTLADVTVAGQLVDTTRLHLMGVPRTRRRPHAPQQLAATAQYRHGRGVARRSRSRCRTRLEDLVVRHHPARQPSGDDLAGGQQATRDDPLRGAGSAHQPRQEPARRPTR